jgi:hypothetical protein
MYKVMNGKRINAHGAYVIINARVNRKNTMNETDKTKTTNMARGVGSFLNTGNSIFIILYLKVFHYSYTKRENKLELWRQR